MYMPLCVCMCVYVCVRLHVCMCEYMCVCGDATVYMYMTTH